MIKQAPSAWRIGIMAAFALSCLGLLLFLWSSFGGALPLQPKGYRIHVRLPDAGQLAQQADVRISGVSIGRVAQLQGNADGSTDAILQIDTPFAPRPADTRAILRQKSLLGEVYLELSPGSKTAPTIPEGGTLQPAQVSRAVRFDEVLRTFDAPVRADFETWMAGQGAVVSERGQALSDLIGSLGPLTDRGGELLTTLQDEHTAVRGLVRDSGSALGALTQRQGELRGLVRSSRAAFAATGASREALTQTVRALGPFLVATRTTVDRTARFSRRATPVTDALLPTARALGPLLRAVPAFSRAAEQTFRAAPAVEQGTRAGVGALVGTLDRTPPVLARLRPFLGELAPILSYATRYRAELAGALGNVTAATQSTLPSGGKPRHLIRAVAALNPESLAAYPSRLATDRANPYPVPGAYRRLAQGLQSYATSCPSTPLPTLSDDVPDDLADLVQRFYLTPVPNPANVACTAQPSPGALTQSATRFPELKPLP